MPYWNQPYQPAFPNNGTGVMYPQQYQSYSPPPQQQASNPQGIQWVDGEVGAKAYQLPQGWPAGTPVALWDTNDQIIYLKSYNQMGMPNPLQKIHYTMDEPPAGYISNNVSGASESNYVTKEDLAALKSEIRDMIKGMSNQKIQNGQQNRGGNT